MKIVKVIKNHKSEFQVPLIANEGDIVEGKEREHLGFFVAVEQMEILA